jgi:CheY-like chemotaxis protein
VQFAAAEAIVGLDPPYGFPGSNRLVPLLARFLGGRQVPRALVIDGNPTRGSQTASALRVLGYDTQVASGGRRGFSAAAESADLELILIDPTSLHGAWGWLDTLSNLRADARTASVPVLITGPSKLDDLLRPSFDRFPHTEFLVSTSDPRLLRKVLDRELPRLGARPLSAAERQKYAEGASALLAKIARPGSPFAADLAAVEPALSLALTNPPARMSAMTALGDVPAVEAQRSLADALIDTSRPAEFRRGAATQLVRSIERFGPLLTNSQERRLAEGVNTESDPTLRSGLAGVIAALRPANTIGARSRPAASLSPAPSTLVVPDHPDNAPDDLPPNN